MNPDLAQAISGLSDPATFINNAKNMVAAIVKVVEFQEEHGVVSPKLAQELVAAQDAFIDNAVKQLYSEKCDAPDQ